MSKKQRKIILYLSPLVLLLALFLAARVKIGQIEADAVRLAQTGRDSMNLMKEHVGGLAAGDLDRLLDCYTPDFRDVGAVAWREELRSERDGVKVYDWRPTDAPLAGLRFAMFLDPDGYTIELMQLTKR